MRTPWTRWCLAAMLAGMLQTIPVPAHPQASNALGSDNVAPSRDRLPDTAASEKERAIRHKTLGDQFRLQDDIGRAGEEYGKALALYRGFSEEDRLMMARYLSWSGRIDEAIRELKAILADDPRNVDARIHLARCLAWKGDLRGSLDVSSKVLADSPGNKDALLVRANALKWSGNPAAAIAIYKEILEKGEDFDTRLGLSQAFLGTGYVRGARDGARQLKVEYPYQEKEVRNLNAEIAKATRSTFQGGYSYYDDSDDNRVDRYSVSAGFWTGAWHWGLGYVYTDADDPSRSAQDHGLAVSTETKFTEWFGAGGTVGLNWTGNDNADAFVVGGVTADAKLFDGRIGAVVARKALDDTAELIENRIRFTEIGAYLEYPLPDQLSFRASYAAREYSDDNRSDDWQGMIRWVFPLKSPSLATAFRVRYLDFQRESGGGYFDPSNYLSLKLELSIDYEKGRGYLHVVPFGGYQSYRRRGDSPEGFFGGAEGVIGARVSDSVALELHGEGSDEAGGSAAGFRYYLAGLRVKARF